MASILLAFRLIISFIVSLILFNINRMIYKKTTGASKAYYFWAMATAFLFIGATYSAVGSIFVDVDNIEQKGPSGILSVIYLSIYLLGYYHIALGALVLPIDLNISKIDLEKLLRGRKYVFLGIIIWSSMVASILLIFNSKIPVRIFYQPFLVLSWFVTIYGISQLYKTFKSGAKHWEYLFLGCIFGFIGSIIKIIAYFFIDILFIIEPLFYGLLGIYMIIGFYKLAKSVEAI